MVKRATFLEMCLAAGLVAVVGACGLAVAKDKLLLKYLPVDYDIETVNQTYNSSSNPVVLQLSQTSSPETDLIVKGHIGCLSCREFDQSCPECCLYNSNTSIHCQANDTDCPYPGSVPFSTNPTACPACAAANCSKTFTRNAGCGSCASPCTKYPDHLLSCYPVGCPGTTKPLNTGTACVENPSGSNIWYCGKSDLKARPACPSNNPAIVSCNYTTTAAYENPGTPVLNSFCNASAPENSTGACYEYKATSNYAACVTECINRTMEWEQKNYEYNNGTLGEKICPTGNCSKSGFDRNCNTASCQKKIDFGCGNFTADACVKIENDFREMLLGNIANTFVEIDPHFRYKFVARSGEKYMLSWQILCKILLGDQKYNLYTMVQVWDEADLNAAEPVFQSIVHQKALNSTFYINAQTGMDPAKSPRLLPGHAYLVKLYYFLPNDGKTDLKVEVSLMQIILYRTKN